jgi:hypothetical protein
LIPSKELNKDLNTEVKGMTKELNTEAIHRRLSKASVLSIKEWIRSPSSKG